MSRILRIAGAGGLGALIAQLVTEGSAWAPSLTGYEEFAYPAYYSCGADDRLERLPSWLMSTHQLQARALSAPVGWISCNAAGHSYGQYMAPKVRCGRHRRGNTNRI